MRIYPFLLLLIFIGSNAQQPTLKKVAGAKQAVFSFIFDDLNTTDSLVKSVFDEFGFQPSFAITTKKLNPKTAPLYKSYAEEGISILSHSHTHPKMNNSSDIDRETVLMELKDSKERIENYGIPVRGFVTPNSYMRPEFLSLLDTEYDYAFTNNHNDLYDISVDKKQLARYGIESNISTSDHSIEKIVSRIDQAITNKELLVLYGHALPSTYLDDLGKPRVTANDLRAILKYLKSKVINGECIVLTSDLAIQEYYR
ncbi:polysaccharide deacetylase family protein [Arenibacter sp. S6351L]|uniref:polysaccharide deacetylase family protein n=1 Tax=Arenibacter sp. S6351L TaxID=2926407 RepID=UPI001FF378F6|nr:polysaccharide deacetylase family protein [Arenibacter sp. S6351L]MCK0135695.1 polysaccharide deacetylase family protein [Arenibacter sp. S6351L]